MMTIKRIRSFEVGLVFRNDEFVRILEPGLHFLFNPLGRVRIEKYNKRFAFFEHSNLRSLQDIAGLKSHAVFVDLMDFERAIVWIDGRFVRILGPGLHAFWTTEHDVLVERIDARQPRFEHADLHVITNSAGGKLLLDVCKVAKHHVGVLFINGQYVETIPPGVYAFWKIVADATIVEVDMRESSLEVAGQEIMTADKVTLRINAIVDYRIRDASKAVSESNEPQSLIYREMQLAIRAVVGSRELDELLKDKSESSVEIAELLRKRAAEVGIEVTSAGIKDIILPGEMKQLLNKVMEARKEAEANLIVRHEETSAIRSQANTAKLLANNPTLMRLRELEVLEKIATSGSMQVVLGEKGLTDRVVNLL